MHDYTVPSELTGGFTNLFQGLPNQTRIIHPSNIPLTTNAYAVSNLGAKKILLVLRHVVGIWNNKLEPGTK